MTDGHLIKELPLNDMTSLNKIIIDQQPYDLDTLPAEARAHIESLWYVDAEIARHEQAIAVLKTARISYAKALVQVLPTTLPDASDVDLELITLLKQRTQNPRSPQRTYPKKSRRGHR